MSNRLTQMDAHLCATVRSIYDLARMLESVRYQSGLGKNQWERVERARKVAAEADQFLASISNEVS
jgi:hypothetical protein